MNRMLHAFAALSALVSIPAQASCWTGREIAAAKVRDLDTMLMVSALRCRMGSSGLLAKYNAFVVQDRVALTAANNMLRAHFIAAAGKARGLDVYDSYVTAVANSYGAGSEGLSCADMASIVDAAAGEGSTLEGLLAVAERAGVQPRLDDETCPLAIASR